ncbi:DNA alkylation repair protein [Mumia sp. ZJ430]|uniref:DNA alkylation repair protein n=1 Tax=Mumia sp. ZJ430 TaxID=2708083 RepID=UPI0014216701|nr:DNA alkylation repair protein [Mumia sp. ZJ430]
MKDDVASVADRLTVALAGHGDAERAEGAARYLKSMRPHLGVRVPDVRGTVRATLRTSGVADPEDVLHLATRLWASEVHEHRLAAVFVLAQRAGALTCEDLAIVEHMLREAETWAIVDPLATEVVSAVTARPGSTVACGDVLDRWARDADFWVRRAALLALLPALRAGGGDWERFSRYADSMLDERELFVRKAIGWVLCDTARRPPSSSPSGSPDVAGPLVAQAYRAR